MFININGLLILVFSIGIGERIISTFFCRREKEGAVKYKWTTYLLIFTYIFCIILALFEFLSQKKDLNIFITSIGIVVEIAGIYLRRVSIKSFAGFWSSHIKSIPGQPLIKSGPYRWFRHPYYLAVILELIGWALFFNAFLAFWVILSVHFPILLYRMFLEEKELLGLFGPEYQKYRMAAGLLFPGFNHKEAR